MRLYAIRRFDENGRPLYWNFNHRSINDNEVWSNIFTKNCITSSRSEIGFVFQMFFDDCEGGDSNLVEYELTEVNPDKSVSLKPVA